MILSWTKNNRYYKIKFQRTLFGTIDLICVWGALSGNLGNYKIISCQNLADIKSIIRSVMKRRKQRGYTLHL